MGLNRREFVTATTLVSGALAAPSVAQAALGKKRVRTIATEEGFATPDYVKAMVAIAQSDWKNQDLYTWLKLGTLPPAGETDRWTPLRDRFVDLPDGRLREMDASGVDMHVLSLGSPGVQLFRADIATEMARTTNDFMTDIIRAHPTRFGGLAAFAPQDPKAAVKEMERAINTLKLNGFLVNSYTDDEYLDAEKYWPILEAAEALGRPIYIHPRNVSPNLFGALSDYYMYGGQWGFGIDTGTHAVRLILSGIFDRFPRLQIVLGHMGEGLPYWLHRLDHSFKIGSRKGASQALKLLPSEYFKRNFLITSSLILDKEVLRLCLDKLSADRIMFAVDHPYGDPVASVDFFMKADITASERAKIFHGTAEKAFAIAPLA